jgi:hypothetical protein
VVFSVLVPLRGASAANKGEEIQPEKYRRYGFHFYLQTKASFRGTVPFFVPHFVRDCILGSPLYRFGASFFRNKPG